MIPGVQAADFADLVPLTRNDSEAPFWVDSQKPDAVQNAPRTMVFGTGPDYLRTMQIPLLRGRFFTPQDTIKSPMRGGNRQRFRRAIFPGQRSRGPGHHFRL